MRPPRFASAILPVSVLLIGLSAPQPIGVSASPTRLDLDRVVDVEDEGVSVVLIALDGVRPVDVFRGAEEARGVPAESAAELMPNLHAMMSRGLVLGGPDGTRPMSASGPNFISLPGYTEMLTGSAPRCQHNDCTERPQRTLVDAFRAAGAGHDDVAVITSWPNIGSIAASAEDVAFVSTGRAHAEPPEGEDTARVLRDALERGRLAADALGGEDYRPDESTIDVALTYSAVRRPRFLFVSLGDTDEHAHEGDYPAYLTALRRDDAFIGQMAERAESWTKAGHPTVVVVTTDHGRAGDFFNHGRDYPDSAVVWMVAAGPGILTPNDTEDIEGSATLSDVTRLVTRVAGLPDLHESLAIGP